MRSQFAVEKEMAELKKLQQKLGASLEWILEALSQEAEGGSATPRKQQALESLAYAKDVLKGSVSVIDDARLFGEMSRENRQENTQEAAHGLSHVSGYPPFPGSLPGTRLEVRKAATSQITSPERRRGLGHSSSSPSLSSPSVRLTAHLPHTLRIPVHEKPADADSPLESALPRPPPQRSASSSSRPIHTETSAKSPIRHDPLGVL
jgi:TBC1 domain family protein 5